MKKILNENMMNRKSDDNEREQLISTSRRDFGISIGIFTVVTVISFMFNRTASDPSLNIAMLYTLGVYLISNYTSGYLYGMLFSAAAVLSVNFFFTYPYGDLNFTMKGYQVTFIGMLIISVISSVSSTRMRRQRDILDKQRKQLMDAEKEKMRANLLRAVSHDIRTPLTGIIGSSDSIIENYDTVDREDELKLIKNINADANWLLNMVENLLTVTRIDNEKAGVTKLLESVDDLISASVAKFKRRFQGTAVKVKIPCEPIMVEMDAMLIEQVIINILQNAKMHSGSDKPLELFVENLPDKVEFHIRDYGKGIETDRLESIFDGAPMNTGSMGVDGNKGMGIGLSICKTIIRAHGGNIIAKNHEEGAEFIFVLPKGGEETGDVSESIDIDN